jgi:hypothetical protein
VIDLIFFLLLLATGNLFFGAFVLMKLWNWFPAVIFDVPTIGLAAALGFIALLSFFKNRSFSGEKKVKYDAGDVAKVLSHTAAFGFVLLLGFLAHLFS